MQFGGGRGEKNGGEAPCPEEIRLKYEVPDKEVTERADLLLNEKGNHVDYIVSYCPPLSIAEFLVGSEAESDTPSVYLEGKKNELEFIRWFFGKYHITKLIPPRYMGVFDEVIAAD